MSPRFHLFIAGLLALGSASGLQAQLEWTTREAKPAVAVGARTVEVAYPFRNTGAKPITILSIKPDCGCTTATLDQPTYAPGESGTIKTVFTIGDRVGLQAKTIWITTDDRPHEPVGLHLVVNIPELLTIEPRIVWWQVGKAAAEKLVTIKLHPGAGITIDDIVCNHPAITHRVETVSADTLRLHLICKDTAKPLSARLWLKVSVPGQESRTFMIFARVQ